MSQQKYHDSCWTEIDKLIIEMKVKLENREFLKSTTIHDRLEGILML